MRLPLLQVRDLRIAFNQGEVVKGISFNLALGEKLALVGESGSGKSVLALSLVKLIEGAKLSGRCLWIRQDEENLAPDATDAPNTHDLVKLSERDLEPIRGQDIAFVFQEPMTALNPVFSVGEQIAEVLRIKRAMTREEAWHEAIDLIKVTGIADPVKRARSYPHQLSGGQRQRVMIAMALACRPRLLIADEPTTALDVSVRSQILDLLDHLQYRFGMAVLLITHDLEAVRRFADRVLVMEKGVVVEQGDAKEVLNTPQHAYTQKLLNSQPIRDVVVPPADAPVILQGWGLGVKYQASGGGIKAWFIPKKFTALQDVNFVLRQGQTLGVIGESGSGKTSLALAALGLVPIQGQMKVSGHSWTGKAGVDLPLRRMVQVVFQDPFASLSPRMNVSEIIAEGLAVHMPELDALGRLRRVLIALSSVGLTEQEFPNLLSRYPHEFSGGQRQRLAIARVLVLDPKVIVLDEPTSALDVTTQKQVLQLLQKLQKQRGLSYLLITHDIGVIRAMAHQVLVVQNAKLVDSGNLDHILNHSTHAYTRLLVNAGYDKK